MLKPMILAAMAALATPALAQTSTEITAPGPLGALHGTLLKPDKPGAVVLIVSGSGPTDRDGNNAFGVKAQPYKLLAEALAARGIASVRIDKRGQFGSKAAVADGNKVRIADYVADVRAWVGAAKAATGARCVWLLGHSEGALIVLATGDAPDVCGIITVSGPGRPFDVLIREQIHANPANAVIFDQLDGGLARLRAGEHVDVATLHPGLAPLFNPAVQDYLIDLIAHDPAKLAAALKSPLLIVQGLADIQVSEADARTLAAARSDARLALVPGVNHVLKNVGTRSDRAANLASYGHPDLPVDAAVVEAIAEFVREKR